MTSGNESTRQGERRGRVRPVLRRGGQVILHGAVLQPDVRARLVVASLAHHGA